MLVPASANICCGLTRHKNIRWSENIDRVIIPLLFSSHDLAASAAGMLRRLRSVSNRSCKAVQSYIARDRSNSQYCITSATRATRRRGKRSHASQPGKRSSCYRKRVSHSSANQSINQSIKRTVVAVSSL